MSLVDRISSFVDGYYKVTNPQKYTQRLMERSAAEHAMRYRQAEKSRLRSHITGMTGGGDEHMNESDLIVMREKSRKLDRDNLFVASIMDRLEEHVLGEAVNIQIQSNNKRWNKAAEKAFKEFWQGRPEIRDYLSGPEIEKLVFRAEKIDGDILIVMLEDQLQVLEAHRISSPKNADQNIINGVKTDQNGKILGYFVEVSQKKHTYYDAKDCVFLAQRHRISMTRGLPSTVRSMDLFDDIDAFMEASIIQQKISAAHCVFITRKGGLDGLDGMETVTDSAGNDRQEQIMSPGAVLYGEMGEDAKMLGASQTGQQFGPFITQLLRFAGLMYGLPLEITSLDFSNTTFSSSRASIQTAHKAFKKQHTRFIREFMAPIVTWKVKQLVSQNKLPPMPDGFKVTATPPKMISVDPLKETKADVERIAAGLTSIREVSDLNGQDWKETLRYREDEIIEAGKIAKNLVKKTGEDFSARDILGMTKNFNKEIFVDESNSETNPD